MTRRLAIAAVLTVCIVFTVAAQPSADAVAQPAIDVLAGPAWDEARYFAFTFNGERDGENVVPPELDDVVVGPEPPAGAFARRESAM